MKLTLQIKIIGLVAIVSIISFFLLTYYLIGENRDALEKSYVSEAKAIANSLDASMASQSELEDIELLSKRINKQIWLNPDIIAISMNIPTESGMRVAISSDSRLTSRVSSEQNRIAYDSDKLLYEIEKNTDERYLVVITPIHQSGKTLGTYEIQYNLESLNEILEKQFLSTILITIIVIILFGLILFFALNIIIIKPITKIQKGFSQVAEGKHNFALNINSKDELGQLAREFEKMNNDIRKSKEKLKELNKELENKVSDRTKQFEDKHDELQRFNKLAIGRELKMIELKKRIKELEGK